MRISSTPICEPTHPTDLYPVRFGEGMAANGVGSFLRALHGVAGVVLVGLIVYILILLAALYVFYCHFLGLIWRR